jgi:hypothetical protein
MNKRTGRNRRRARARRPVFDSEAAADVREVDSLKAKPKTLARRWKKKSRVNELPENIDHGLRGLAGGHLGNRRNPRSQPNT